eukprot:388058-Pyramimonas_sp.AAC.1
MTESATSLLMHMAVGTWSSTLSKAEAAVCKHILYYVSIAPDGTAARASCSTPRTSTNPARQAGLPVSVQPNVTVRRATSSDAGFMECWRVDRWAVTSYLHTEEAGGAERVQQLPGRLVPRTVMENIVHQVVSTCDAPAKSYEGISEQEGWYL